MTTLAPVAGAVGAIGAAAERPDVAAKFDGSFEFANDRWVPGMLFGATVRGRGPHSRLVAVRTAAALAVPGVVAVLTADDVPGAEQIGHITRDQPVFAGEVVRYEGEPVAFVVARSQELARLAAGLVEVVEEPLVVLDDPERALDDDVPQLHPEGNLYRRLVIRRGSSTNGAPVEVEATFATGRQDQAFLGPESALAMPDPDGGVTLHLATQDLHLDQAQIAAALDLPPELVRLVLGGVGGAFGGREDITCQVHLCLAALRTGRPVKTTYLRSESFLAHPKRHPARLHYRVGAEPDGRLRYVVARIRLDGGAYTSTSGPICGVASYFAAGPYRVPAVDVLCEAVATNNPVSGAMRGFGAVQACFGIESAMDLLAAKLGMDPVALRRTNALRPGDCFPTSGQAVHAPAPVLEVIDRCAALPLPPDPRLVSPSRLYHPYSHPGGTGRTSLGEGVRRGVGFAVGVKHMLYGEGTPERCTATVRMSGAGVEVVSAAAECGQGIGSALVQVVRTELGDVPVWLAPASTEAGYAGSSSASRQTWMSGSAVRDACRELRERVAALVAGRWGVAPGDVTVDGTILVGGAAVPLVEALGGEVVEATAVYRPPITSAGDPTSGQGDVHVGWMFVAHRAVVDVDVELGTVRVVQVATAQDVGRAINPREVRGQIIGGISQGVGLALTEELLSSGGRVLNAGFTDYLVPTAADMGEVLVDLVEVGDRHGPYGAKGVGEPPSLSSTPAVVAAIRAATGRPCSRVPVRPWDIVDVDADPGAVTR